MKQSEIVNVILFDYNVLSELELIGLISNLPNKILRYLGENHPDNKTRKIFFEKTNVTIGQETVINKHLVISDDYLPLLKIGNRVAISPNVTIICASGPNNSLLKNSYFVRENLIVQKEVVIEDDAWIGANVTLLPGVIIGKRAIIGAGSVVTKNVEGNAIYSGVPANLKKYIYG